MSTTQEIKELAKLGADSVFAYISRTAEEAPDGFVWQTLNYENRPQYHYMVYNGVAGISFFLADYFRLTGISRAKELALGGNRWCSNPEHAGFTRGLYLGRTGIGMAWLHLSRAIDQPSLLDQCRINASPLLTEHPGPVTDILGGAAGNGLFLIRLWEATGDKEFLQGAIRNAMWLEEVATHDALGTHWEMGLWRARMLGFAHGLSGIAYFLIALFSATGDNHWAELSRKCLNTLLNQSKPDRGGLNWPEILGGHEVDCCQWCHGAPGVGLAFAQAFEVFKDPDDLSTASAAGETTFQYGDVRENPCQCHGLSGNAELFIELYRLTGEQKWLNCAYDFAKKAFSYRHIRPEGDVWQADEPDFYSQDYMFGAAGVGHFFLRLLEPSKLRMPLS